MQSPGAYALVNAMKNNPESVLLEFDFRVIITTYQTRMRSFVNFLKC